ncbi:TonB-dependent siderophore receptor [Chryseobacterium geocarposphaerae]|uniref:Iron complex outermembrane receptor protein n=1 Tax=Chryseobacterium geocarposphaerae TaxID=1416776 RepID=A0A2M9C2I8_9FLAO|nr:TonB-dependent receptor [Chryseobacterium geocarposphaerae]PJJ64644.1 iron complex outermembrane receptor protein [Chryseobacterium geocarposphaerae]
MKNVLICASLLGSMLTFAQEKDSTKTKNIDAVIINTYIKKDSDFSNKMSIKAIEDPQVFSSINKSVLENQAIFTVDDAYRNITGLQQMWSPTSRAGDGGSFIVLRGFPSNNSMRNGLVSPVTTTIDAVNIERLEVLKGPSGTLYGSNVASYGGLVNRITKRPFENFEGQVSFMGGSYNTYRAQADINTPLTKDKKLLFRINTAYTNQGTFQKTDAKNSYFAFTPSLTYNLNDKLQFNIEYEMFNTRAIGDQFFFYLNPGSLNGIDNMKDLEKAGLNYKESYIGDDLYTTARVNNIFGQVNYKINNNIKSSTNINTSSSYSDGFGPYFSASVDTNNNVSVSRFDQATRDSRKKYLQIQQNFNFDYSFGNGMRNRTVVGFDYLKTKDRSRFIYLANGATYTVPANGGDYSDFNGTTLGALYDNPENISHYDVDGDTNTYSGYISNVFTPISELNIVLGLRYENNDFLGGKVWVNDTPAYNQSAWSPKAGLVYQIIKDKFSVFGNYQNSFKSNGYYTTDLAGSIALSDPERANQFETGFKANLINGKINATVSYYNIKAKNMLFGTGQYTAAGNAVQTQTGEIQSKGIELEVNAYLIKGFSLIGGVSYNDTTDLSTGFRPSTAGSPWLANFNASYQFVDGSLKGFGFGIGGNYANANKIYNQVNPATTRFEIFTLPKYFVLNANAFYDAKKFRIGLKVDNFTNQHYWIGYTTGNPQKLINALGTITYKF